MDGLEIRRTGPADKDAILAINDYVYDGLDYLKAFFDDVFINCPVATPYVAVYRDEIVGFLAAFLVDDGDTVVSRGGRIRSEWSRRGFYKQLKLHCLESSNASVNAFTAFNTNVALRSSTFQKENNLILSRPMVRYDFDLRNLPMSGGKQKTPISITTLTQPLLQHFMTSEKHSAYLFPNNRLIVNWVPFKLLSTNIPIIWLMDEQSCRLSDVRYEDGVIQGLLSISTTFYGSSGVFVCQLDIYGTDCRSLNRHIDFHLDFIRQQTNGGTTMLIFCDQPLTSTLEKIFKEIHVEKTIWRSSDDPEAVLETQCLLEKQISANACKT